MKKLKVLHFYFIAALLILTILFVGATSTKENNGGSLTELVHEIREGLPQIIKPVQLEEDYNFAGEALPMNNFDVKERLDRELLVNSYWHSSTILNIKHTTRYFPIIEKILAEEELPDDFKYLSVAESGLRHETSPAGAKGLWQLMKPTATYYGLEVNSEVDERFHVEKATKAACKYLKDYYRQFGNWTSCAVAYNMGGPKFKEAMKTQRSDSYYDLNLNAETNRYIFRIVALKEILENPTNYGFELTTADGLPILDSYQIVEVDGQIQNLGDFAKKHGTSYRMLKVFNPWLLSHKLTNSTNKVYQIKIPK